MRRDKVRLSRRHQRWLYATSAILFLTGVLWLVLHQFLRLHAEFGDAPHPLEPWSLKLHGAAAMLFLVLLGTLLSNHIRRGWRLHKNRVTGTIFVASNALLILTGYGLYYVGGEASRARISASHWVLGLVSPVVLLWHVWAGQKQARLNRNESSADARHLQSSAASSPPRRTTLEH